MFSECLDNNIGDFKSRAFIIHLYDKNSTEVMQVIRDRPICRGFCMQNLCYFLNDCCVQDQVHCEAPVGYHIATIKQVKHTNMSYKVLNVNENITFNVKPVSKCKNIFHIVQNDQGLVGTLIKISSKAITNEKHMCILKYSLQLPPKLNVEMKAALLATSFLLDLKYFEGLVVDDF